MANSLNTATSTNTTQESELTLLNASSAAWDGNFTVVKANSAAWTTASTSSGRVLNVQSRSEASTTGFSADSWALFNSSLDVTITPQLSSSKFMLTFTAPAGAYGFVFMRFLRGSTPIGVGGGSGSRKAVNGATYMGGGDYDMMTGSYMDSPATASEIVYHVEVFCPSGTGYLNRSAEDADSNSSIRGTANFTVMEISG
jgi:hypothetical protein